MERGDEKGGDLPELNGAKISLTTESKKAVATG
ncbi:hypothetical protein ZOSMA_98G00060 [Zostera marina]|uniref:Uncharacterized protein n=1 Tax=Zostera marina TaxID=29655 RepID=A0A0K9NHT9_ZOSMR|nr:hypothetical protein ZOSMA_98G00060 [Zostera marina]